MKTGRNSQKGGWGGGIPKFPKCPVLSLFSKLSHLPSGSFVTTSSPSSTDTARASPSWPAERHPSRPASGLRILKTDQMRNQKSKFCWMTEKIPLPLLFVIFEQDSVLLSNQKEDGKSATSNVEKKEGGCARGAKIVSLSWGAPASLAPGFSLPRLSQILHTLAAR